MKKLNKKGFTLAELLVVVAIIAVLTAIAIPVFSAQLEKAREAVDAANIRAAYAEVMSEYLTGGTNTSKDVAAKQTTPAWSTTIEWPENLGTVPAAGTNGWTVSVDGSGNPSVVAKN